MFQDLKLCFRISGLKADFRPEIRARGWEARRGRLSHLPPAVPVSPYGAPRAGSFFLWAKYPCFA